MGVRRCSAEIAHDVCGLVVRALEVLCSAQANAVGNPRHLTDHCVKSREVLDEGRVVGATRVSCARCGHVLQGRGRAVDS